MQKLKHLFGDVNMTWPRVLLFAVLTGVYTGVIMSVTALKETSFQDIGIYLEWWFLFAIFLIVNCHKWWDAALKCFVFFLVSQPLVYLVQVPFSHMGWQLFMYYPYWFRITLLTIPGAAVAFLVKKKNWLSVPILSVATGYLAVQAVIYFGSVRLRFPHHLLSCIFCLAQAVFLIFILLEQKKHRAAALAVFAAGLIFYAVYRFA